VLTVILRRDAVAFIAELGTRRIASTGGQGFYALRRGIATALAEVDSAMSAKSALRHANMATTTAHYI
jgi:hypothetical protein